ncbi:MAG: hypothetical protein A2Z14_17430 [Chloroflexi bacterium RBG_16_48_8]|nr:MAG: hypothetical protein A2Z14_17430 [Chloroflexi bacterium RBG_16_48_8]
MKSMELLTLQGQLFGADRKQAKSRAEELLELVKLTDAVDRRVGTYSGGMRRRLDLALALVHKPEILFLDEPTTGLDPSSRRDVWDEVRRLNRELGMTIFLTTQYLEEADELAEKAKLELSSILDQIQTDRDVVRVYLNQAAQAIPNVVNRLQQADLNPISLTLTQPTLDDVFLQVTGERFQRQETVQVET